MRNLSFFSKGLNLSYLVVALLCFVFSVSAQTAAKGPSARFDKVWIEYGVTEDGVLGMKIHTKFTVSQMKNVDGYIVVHFTTGDNVKLKDKNKKVFDVDGNVALYKDIKPGYEEADYADYPLFMPYGELDLEPGEYDLKMDIDLLYENGDIIQHLTFYDFNYKKAEPPGATYDKTWVDYGVTENGQLGMRIHSKFTTTAMKGIDSQLAVRFQRKGGDKLTSSIAAFTDKSGNAVVYKPMKPCCDPAEFEDLTMFVPYSAFDLGKGSFNLQMDIDLEYEDGDLIKHLDLYDFVFKR